MSEGNTPYHIINEGDPKKYFHQIPNIADEGTLTPNEYRLLGHYIRRGECYEGIRTTARFCRMNKDTVTKTRNSLTEKGWISVEEREDGGITVRVLDRWAENIAYFQDKVSESRGRGVSESEGQQVSETEGQAVRNEGTKEEPIKEEPLKEKHIKNGAHAPQSSSVYKTVNKQKFRKQPWPVPKGTKFHNESYRLVIEKLEQITGMDATTSWVSFEYTADYLMHLDGMAMTDDVIPDVQPLLQRLGLFISRWRGRKPNPLQVAAYFKQLVTERPQNWKQYTFEDVSTPEERRKYIEGEFAEYIEW